MTDQSRPDSEDGFAAVPSPCWHSRVGREAECLSRTGADVAPLALFPAIKQSRRILMLTPNRLIMSADAARTFAPFDPVARCSGRPGRVLRKALDRATPGARRIGVVRLPQLGLSLPVYRARVHGSAYDVVVREDRGALSRVVGLVPINPDVKRAGRTRTDSTDVAFSESEAAILALELLGAESDEELDHFLGKLFKSVAKVAKGVGNTIGKVGNAVGSAIDKVNKFIPIKSILSFTPIGMANRLYQGARQVASGQNVFKVAKGMVQKGLKDLGNVAQLASTVASFIPGIGTGVAAALGAAGALASGRPITEAILEAAKSALPGGALAATAFDVASGLVQGKNLSEAALSAARNRLPGGQAAKAAFDAGLALAQGKKLQEVAVAAVGGALPASRFATTAVNFASRVARGENLQKAALSTAGQRLAARVGGLPGAVVQGALAAA
jgi:hypothetical protein